METKELRLGNLIQVKNLHVLSTDEQSVFYKRVDEIDSWSDNICFEDRYNAPKNICSGIKLTDEILKCTNLEYISSSFVYLMPKGTIYYNYRIKFEVWSECIKCYIGGFEKEIEYLHELQNLYFSIAGEELEIDTKKLNELNTGELSK